MKTLIIGIIIVGIPFFIFKAMLSKPAYSYDMNLAEIEKKIVAAQIQYAKVEGNPKLDEDDVCDANILTQKTIKRIVIHHTVVTGDLNVIYNAISRNHEQRRAKGMAIYADMPADTMEQVKTEDGKYMMYHRLIGKNGDIAGTREETQVGRGGKYNCDNIESYHIALIGNFEKQEPTQAQYDSLNAIIKILRDKYGDIPVVAHGAMEHEQTACPGKLFNWGKIEPYEGTVAQVVEKKDKIAVSNEPGLLGTFNISRYYSCDKEQTRRLSWEKNINQDNYTACMKRQFAGTDADTTQPAYGAKFTNADAGIAIACPRTLKPRTRLRIEGYDKIVQCRDYGSAITEGRLDMYTGIGDWAIDNFVNFPSGKRKVYIVS